MVSVISDINHFIRGHPVVVKNRPVVLESRPCSSSQLGALVPELIFIGGYRR
jgi:hypothetical protein